MTTPPPPGTGTPPAWRQDPQDAGLIRHWDGLSWSPYTLPKPAGWGGNTDRAQVRWWQTWWAVVPGLLLCLPVGLIGLWTRPGVSNRMRTVVTLATVVLLGGALLTDDPDNKPAPSASVSTETPSAQASAAQPSAVATPAADSAEADTTAEDVAAPEPVRPVMPLLTGLPQRRAERALAAAGITVRQVKAVASSERRGTVLRQGRPAGASLRAGSGIVLVVAAPYPQVPSVVGRPEAQAVARLQGAGFTVKVTTESRTSGEDDVVLSQTPSGATRVAPGSVVSVVVSSVVRTVAPPPSQSCTAGYRPCLPPKTDYDCAGGSGDGPGYATGPVYISGSDPYDLDSDGDGVACES